MTIDERIPGYSDQELAALLSNVLRLAESGSAKQKAEAERLKPLVESAIAERAPAKAPARRRAKADNA